MGIPAVMGALDLPAYELEGILIVDGRYGDVYTQPSEQRLLENTSLLDQRHASSQKNSMS